MILNNKGMAISGILYSILVLFIVLIFGVLSVLASTKYSFDKFRKDIIAKLSQEENIEEETKVEYKEALLNGTDPVLKNGMIPVKINNDGTVTRANLNESWYNYESKMWANMVLVDDSVRDVYMNYTGDEILDKSKILAYFVWIPRYRYKIPTGGTATPSTIDIVFENKETNKSTGDEINNYLLYKIDFENINVNLENCYDYSYIEQSIIDDIQSLNNKSNTNGESSESYSIHDIFSQDYNLED